jgi:hypothetical protein
LTDSRAAGDSRPAPAGISPHAADIAAILRRRRRLAAGLAALALLTLALLAYRGGGYYLLDPGARLAHPHDRALRPSGVWGHGVGIVATLVMLMNFLYPLRKRAIWMSRMGSVPMWLIFHVSVGLMTPLVILFHAAFRFNNLIATFTYGSLVVVVVTGLIGRYIYSMVPGTSGLKRGELTDLQRSWQETIAGVRADLGEASPPQWLDRLLVPPIPAREASAGRAFRAVLAWPGSAFRARAGARSLAGRLPHERGRALTTAVGQMVRLRLQIEFFGGIKRLLATWRFGHSLLALFLVVVIIAHVAVSIAFGYRWIF